MPDRSRSGAARHALPPVTYPSQPCASTPSTTTCPRTASPRRRGPAGRAACSFSTGATGAVAHRRFADLPELLRPGDLLVRNDVRVRPARLYGRDAEERLVEIFLLRPRRPGSAALARAREARPPGANRAPHRLRRRRGRRGGRGRATTARGPCSSTRRSTTRALDAARPHSPASVHPPGRRSAGPARGSRGVSDRLRARAARGRRADRGPALHRADSRRDPRARRRDRRPDAGGRRRHFQAGDRRRHRRPRRSRPEDVVLPATTRAAVAAAKACGPARSRRRHDRDPVARGRARRGATPDSPANGASRPISSSRPASSSASLDGLLTNFHLPRSTLLMLVSAFAGRERVLAAYAEAMREGYPLLFVRRRDVRRLSRPRDPADRMTAP